MRRHFSAGESACCLARQRGMPRSWGSIGAMVTGGRKGRRNAVVGCPLSVVGDAARARVGHAPRSGDRKKSRKQKLKSAGFAREPAWTVWTLWTLWTVWTVWTNAEWAAGRRRRMRHRACGMRGKQRQTALLVIREAHPLGAGAGRRGAPRRYKRPQGGPDAADGSRHAVCIPDNQ